MTVVVFKQIWLATSATNVTHLKTVSSSSTSASISSQLNSATHLRIYAEVTTADPTRDFVPYYNHCNHAFRIHEYNPFQPNHLE
jgi:hypothetical protein